MPQYSGTTVGPVSSRGFSLIELIIVMVIFSVLVAIAGPAMSTWRQDNELRTSARELTSVLNYARSEAIARNAVITVSTTSGDDNWSGDVQVYVDVSPAGGNTAFNNATDTLLKNITAGGGDKVEILSNASAEDFVSYTATGALNEGGDTASFGICDSRGNASGYQLSVNNVGRVSSNKMNGVGSCDP